MIVYDIINTSGIKLSTTSSMSKAFKIVELHSLLNLRITKRHTNIFEWLWNLV